MQSERLPLYEAAAARLIEQGNAYQVLYLASPLLKQLPKVAREPEPAS